MRAPCWPCSAAPRAHVGYAADLTGLARGQRHCASPHLTRCARAGGGLAKVRCVTAAMPQTARRAARAGSNNSTTALGQVGLAVDQYDPADGGADDTRWWRCMRAWMARHDIDWGFWALQVALLPHPLEPVGVGEPGMHIQALGRSARCWLDAWPRSAHVNWGCRGAWLSWQLSQGVGRRAADQQRMHGHWSLGRYSGRAVEQGCLHSQHVARKHALPDR